MPVGYKRRKWQAVLTISASGPEFSPLFKQHGYFFKPRMAADLRYTTADVDVLESYFRTGDYDSGEEEIHLRLRNPTREQFFGALYDIERWLGNFRHDPDWDGGSILLCFAGHGQQGDGALVLTDGIIAPSDLIGSLTRIASNVSRPGRLRISATLDSCHSAAFTTELLDACFNKHSELIVPFHVDASCMHDEFAWEEDGLGHGVFTYCFSARGSSPTSLAATAVQPDNTYGPSLAIVGDEMGCSLLTAGEQNSVLYWNGTGHLEVCGRVIDLFESGKCMSLEEMWERLQRERDCVVEVIKPMRHNRFTNGRVTDEEMRASIRDTTSFILNPMDQLRRASPGQRLDCTPNCEPR